MTLNEIEIKAEQLKDLILNAKSQLEFSGNIYYVSNDGDDDNSGLSITAPWKSLEKVSNSKLSDGDTVLFRCGDIFRGYVKTHSNVTYGSYGNGKKPRLYGSEKNLADETLWELFDGEHNIWRLTEKTLDVGTLVFNDGEYHSVKLIPSYIGNKFVCRDDENKPFDVRKEMLRDLDVYWHFDEKIVGNSVFGNNSYVPDVKDDSKGEVYLRCDKGNPGKIFKSIENLAGRHMFYVGSNENVKIDNLCMKYIGKHAVAAGGNCVKGLNVTNCEIGWIGGAIQHYAGTDPNYPQGKRGSVTRFGNGVEVYGGCSDYKVSNCYIYQVYDAGITHQITTNGEKFEIKNVLYKNNLIENCVYGIEYFLDMNNGDTESIMDGINICENIIRLSGYGWGQQRHNTDTPALIKGWNYVNRAKNFVICDNIFDRCRYRMLHLVAKQKESLPILSDNIYIQNNGGMIGEYGENNSEQPDMLLFDFNAEKTISEILCDKEAKVLILDNR